MSRTTVKRGYELGAINRRVLIDSEGRVSNGEGWSSPAGRIVTLPGVYERWVDVPQAWLGVAMWWR